VDKEVKIDYTDLNIDYTDYKIKIPLESGIFIFLPSGNRRENA